MVTAAASDCGDSRRPLAAVPDPCVPLTTRTLRVPGLAHLLLLTGDKEYGDTSLPSSGLERLLLREYWGQGHRAEWLLWPRGLGTPKHPKPTQNGLDAADRAAPAPPTALSLTGPWLPLAHREETLVLGRRWLQPPILRLRVLHLLNACAQQLVLQQC